MNVINAAGQIIEPRALTDEEKVLAHLEWPKDASAIWDLSEDQFKAWLYGLDPRTAMLFANSPTFRLMLDVKKNKWRFIWRLLWVS